MKTYISLIIIVVFAFSSQAQDDLKTKSRIEKIVRKELKNKDVHNAFLALCSPTQDIDWTFVDGEFQNGDKVDKAHPFHTASIGKTFTAAAIALLVDQGKLNFEDKISQHLPQSVLQGLHVHNDKEYSQEITISQLLQHTSGLPDYVEGETIDGSPNALNSLLEQPSKMWTPIEMIELAKVKMVPHFAPGTGFHYNDTGYVLLGLLIEEVSGLQLHEFFLQNIFEPLAMNNTYMHSRSQPILTSKTMAELYMGSFELSNNASLSLDWAGGGLVSTGQDLNKFQLALHTHEIITAETLSEMQHWIPESKGVNYGFGLRKVNFKELFPTLPDLDVIGNTGSTSSFMFYCPEYDVYLSGTLNQLDQTKKSIMVPVKTLMQFARVVDK